MGRIGIGGLKGEASENASGTQALTLRGERWVELPPPFFIFENLVVLVYTPEG